MRQLVLQTADEPDRVVSWDAPLLTLGSAPANDLVVEGADIAPYHLVLRDLEENDSVLLFDLGGESGTFVNGVRVAGAWSLAQGDEVLLGRLRLSYRGARPSPRKAAAAPVAVSPDPGASEKEGHPDHRRAEEARAWQETLSRLQAEENQIRQLSGKPLSEQTEKQADELALRRQLLRRIADHGREREVLLALKLIGLHDELHAGSAERDTPVLRQLEQVLKEHSLRPFHLPPGAPWQTELEDLAEAEDLPHAGMVVDRTLRLGWFFDDGSATFLLRPAKVALTGS